MDTSRNLDLDALETLNQDFGMNKILQTFRANAEQVHSCPDKT